MLESRESLYKLIEKTFSDVPYPGDDKIGYFSEPLTEDGEIGYYTVPIFETDDNIDSDIDARWTQNLFKGRLSKDVDGLLGTEINSAEDLQYMTPQAVLYYLPCYMKYIVQEKEEWEFLIVIGLIGFFEELKSGVQYPSLYPSFSSEQKKCILNVLIFIKNHIAEYELDPYEDEYKQKIIDLIAYWNF